MAKKYSNRAVGGSFARQAFHIWNSAKRWSKKRFGNSWPRSLKAFHAHMRIQHRQLRCAGVYVRAADWLAVLIEHKKGQVQSDRPDQGSHQADQ